MLTAGADLSRHAGGGAPGFSACERAIAGTHMPVGQLMLTLPMRKPEHARVCAGPVKTVCAGWVSQVWHWGTPMPAGNRLKPASCELKGARGHPGMRARGP